jgi:nucleoid DNA-binding protein
MYKICEEHTFPIRSSSQQARRGRGSPIAMYDLLCLCSKSEMNGSSEPFPPSIKTELEATRQIEIRGLGSFSTSLQEPTILKSVAKQEFSLVQSHSLSSN